MSTARASDVAILRCAAAAMRETVIPALDEASAHADEHTRATAVQLVGLLEHAASRPPDPAPARRAALRAALDAIATNPLVARHQPGEPEHVAAAVLVDCVGRDDAAAVEARRALRPVLVGQLDDELAATLPLVEAFRGRLRDA